MVILTKRLRKFVLSEDKSGYNKPTQRKYYNEITTRAKFAIDQLALIAEKMPSRYTERIFNAKTLMPLFRTILKAPEDITEDDRTRLLEMAQILINILSYDLAPTLTPELYMLLKDARIEKDMVGLKALWLTQRGYNVKKT